MFDFFDEIIEYLSQIVANANYLSGFADSVVKSSLGALNFAGKLSTSLPSSFAWVIPMTLVAVIFDYIRGR